jgi:acetyltransferase-like isoleucine patch superfamily enzyme
LDIGDISMAIPVISTIRTALRNTIVVLYRLALIHVWHMEIGEGTTISLSARLDKTNPRGIHIGKYTAVTFGVAILTHDYVKNCQSDVWIGDNCFIGAGSVILPGVTIGNNCIVAPLSVIGHNVRSGSLVVGNPARIVESNLSTGHYGVRTPPETLSNPEIDVRIDGMVGRVASRG